MQTTPPFTVVRGFEVRRERARSLQEAFRIEFPDRDVIVHAGDVHDAGWPAGKLIVLPSHAAVMGPCMPRMCTCSLDPDRYAVGSVESSMGRSITSAHAESREE